MGTIYTINYEVFWAVDTILTMHYVIFSGGGYYSYYALSSIFREWVIFIVCTT